MATNGQDLDTLVAHLRGADWRELVATRDAIAACGPELLPTVLAELADPASPVTYGVLGWILEQWGDAAFDPLVAALAAAPPAARPRLTGGYLRLRPADPSRFTDTLRHPAPAVRDAAAYLLTAGRARDFDPTVRVDEELPRLADPDPEMRARAAWVLPRAGRAALPGAREMRRTVPAARAAALEVLAALDWAALEPAEIAAVRRLVRIKAPRETPEAVCREFEPWYAVPTADQPAVLDAFGLSDAEPVTMRMGLSAWYHDWGLAAFPARRCYVTPVLDGWTLVFGEFPGVEKAIPVCEAVSRRLGECHWYASGWLVARAGRVVRYCDPEAYPGQLAELGDPLPFEDEYGDPGLREVLAAISVDPERLGPHTRVEGRGVLALTAAGRALGPGAGALSI